MAKIDRSGFTVGEVADFAAHLPPDSATARALNPEWFLTADAHLLRALEHGVRVLAWQQTKDAGLKNPKNYPAQIPLTFAEAEAAKPEREKYDAEPIADMAEFLGWSPSNLN